MLSNNDRSLLILEALLKEVNGCALSQLAVDLDIPKSAMHRILTAMKEMGYIYQDESSQDRKSTRLNSSHLKLSRMPSSA